MFQRTFCLSNNWDKFVLFSRPAGVPIINWFFVIFWEIFCKNYHQNKAGNNKWYCLKSWLLIIDWFTFCSREANISKHYFEDKIRIVFQRKLFSHPRLRLGYEPNGKTKAMFKQSKYSHQDLVFPRPSTSIMSNSFLINKHGSDYNAGLCGQICITCPKYTIDSWFYFHNLWPAARESCLYDYWVVLDWPILIDL